MIPVVKHISVTRTARYFVLGEPHNSIRQILFVLHGYGMNAGEFINEFQGIAGNGTIIVAPEGLSRYYRKGFSGDVVASWMTKEDRDSEINDYKMYLDLLHTELVTSNDIKVFVLGFSQGASTASRWVMKGNSRIDGLIIWGGEFAADIPEFKSGLTKITHVIGKSDQYISIDRFKNQTQYIESKGFEVKEFQFDGDHRIDNNTLTRVFDDLCNQA